jgi:hypothetical protein
MKTSLRLAKSALSEAVPDFCAPTMTKSGNRRLVIAARATPRLLFRQAAPAPESGVMPSEIQRL